MELKDIKDLKQEATELGLQFSPNIGVTKLSEKIDSYYESQENSDKPTIIEEDEGTTKPQTKSNRAEVIRQVEVAAKKTRVITIVDNDQRVNNYTTTAVTSCENAYFNLGTMRLPLNVPVEVMQGHIDALKGVEIPQHTKNAKTGMTEVRIRPRYSISYEN